MDKKGIYWYEQWGEVVIVLFLILGIVLAVSSRSAVITYAVSILAGVVAGFHLYIRKSKLKLVYYISLILFLLGFLLGSFYGSRKIVLVLFLISMYGGYYLGKKHIFEFKEEIH